MSHPQHSTSEAATLPRDTPPALPFPARKRLGPAPPRPSRRTSAHRAADRPTPTSRRMRRHNNDRRLAMAAAEAECLPVSHVDLRDLFERKSRSAWSALSQDAESRRIWDAFVDLDDDTQAGLLRADHSVALHRVNRRLRFLIKERADFVTPLVKRVEDAVVNLSPGHRVVLHMPLPVERLVAHGVAQFHHMGHRSFGVGKDRITVIHARRRVGPARLLDLLV